MLSNFSPTRILSQRLTLPDGRRRLDRTTMGVAGGSGVLLCAGALVR
jgi:hypothetical protein